MRSSFVLVSVCLSLLAGCGDGGSGSVPTVPVSDVLGTFIDTHVTETGDVPNPRTSSEYEVSGVVALDDGTTQEIMGIISDDGTFRIPAVPEGPYSLRLLEYFGTGALPPRYIADAPRNIDLGRLFTGRPDAGDCTLSPTEIIITATGLDAWADGDDLELFSLGAGAAGTLVPTDLVLPDPGATALSNYSVDTSALLSAKLVNGDMGDHAVVTQLVTYADFTAAYRSVLKVFALPSFTQTDGGSVKVSGAFTSVPQKKLDISLDDVAFAALVPSVHSTAEYGGKDVRIIAEPGGERATVSPTPTLLAVKSGQKLALPSPFFYGNPFEGKYAEVISAGYVYTMTHTTTEGIPKQVAVAVGKSGSLADFADPVTPLLSPPLDIRVNDAPTSDTLTGVGQTPMISWTAPATGTPAVYIVALRRLDPGGATTKTMALFSTKETSLKLPGGLLEFGYSYYVRVSVRGEFDSAVPFRGGTKTAYASGLTGVLVQ